jgi:hypothetical protein
LSSDHLFNISFPLPPLLRRHEAHHPRLAQQDVNLASKTEPATQNWPIHWLNENSHIALESILKVWGQYNMKLIGSQSGVFLQKMMPAQLIKKFPKPLCSLPRSQQPDIGFRREPSGSSPHHLAHSVCTRSGFDYQQGQEIISTSQRPDRFRGPLSILSNGYRRCFPRR